jgi:hypothetical protein
MRVFMAEAAALTQAARHLLAAGPLQFMAVVAALVALTRAVALIIKAAADAFLLLVAVFTTAALVTWLHLFQKIVVVVDFQQALLLVRLLLC